jgi:hypothetical protein
MILPPRTPSSAVMTTRDSQSLMRLARLSGREAAEHDRMDRADARAGEHRVRRFRDHRHVDGDAIALFDAARLQDVGEAADFACSSR